MMAVGVMVLGMEGLKVPVVAATPSGRVLSVHSIV
jgi:hypothetical protein